MAAKRKEGLAGMAEMILLRANNFIYRKKSGAFGLNLNKIEGRKVNFSIPILRGVVPLLKIWV